MEGSTETIVLMSIKPRYAEQIMTVRKRWEYRKTNMVKLWGVPVYLYATKPAQRIVGRVVFDAVLSGDPEGVWGITNCWGGLGRGEYDRYFSGTSKAYAGHICRVQCIDGPSLERIREAYDNDNGPWMPPQSWMEIKHANPVFWGLRG